MLKTRSKGESVKRTRFTTWRLLSVAALAALLFVPALDSQEAATAPEDTSPTIKVDVSVVNVLASVRDGKGRQIANLKKEDFELKEDGKPQRIVYFASETTLPLTIGLLVDSSVSFPPNPWASLREMVRPSPRPRASWPRAAGVRNSSSKMRSR